MYADVLRLVDFNLATIRRKNEHQSPGAAARGACELAICPLVCPTISPRI